MEMVTIPKEEYEKLKDDSELLMYLYNMGVDNWEGYQNAYDLWCS